MEMKDMIVIKNLPSNIVEEAWVVIKPEVRNKEKELIKAINMLNDKYKNAIYLIKIEELSYKETSEILRRNN